MSNEYLKFIVKLVNIYDTDFHVGNPNVDDDYWFNCPECHEPILLGDDWTLDEVKDCCPICGFEWEE